MGWSVDGSERFAARSEPNSILEVGLGFLSYPLPSDCMAHKTYIIDKGYTYGMKIFPISYGAGRGVLRDLASTMISILVVSYS